MFGLILGLYMFVLAAILGVILLIMEGEFPGWGTMLLCVLAAVIPAAIVNAVLRGFFGLPGAIVGSVCAGFAISALTGMSVKRSTIAAGIFFLAQIMYALVLAIVGGARS
jgi:hypothetical protein